jgi:ankyrin repeat protein
LPHCDPNLADRAGQTLLMFAAWTGQAECLEALLPCANVNATTPQGKTVHDFARLAVGLRGARCLALIEDEALRRATARAKTPIGAGAAESAALDAGADDAVSPNLTKCAGGATGGKALRL